MSLNQEFIQKPRLSAIDLEQRWKITRKTILKWAETGKLPKRHRIGTRQFWTVDQIEAWERDNIIPAEPAESATAQ